MKRRRRTEGAYEGHWLAFVLGEDQIGPDPLHHERMIEASLQQRDDVSSTHRSAPLLNPTP
eukprot:1783755-Rhodomonas_salina.3